MDIPVIRPRLCASVIWRYRVQTAILLFWILLTTLLFSSKDDNCFCSEQSGGTEAIRQQRIRQTSSEDADRTLGAQLSKNGEKLPPSDGLEKQANLTRDVNNLIHEALKSTLDPDTKRLLEKALENLRNRGERKAAHSEKLSKDVCPEKYLGADHPWREDSWGFETCRYAPKIEDMVTLLINAIHYTDGELESLVKQVRELYPSVGLLIAISGGRTTSGQFKNCKYISVENDNGWRQLIPMVTSKYTLALPNVKRFTRYTKVERLISFASRFNVSVVGGASVGSNGHWWHGCHRLLYKHYRLRYEYGYDKSRDSCMYCDHVEGPFLALTSELKRYLYQTSADDNLVFAHIFLSMKRKRIVSATCPDSMFHVDQIGLENQFTKDDWTGLAKSFQLNEITTFSKQTFQYTCAEMDMKCPDFSRSLGRIQPPCCLAKLTMCNKMLIKIAEANEIPVLLQAGTLMCAVKLNKECPWDLDSDLIFHNRHMSKLVSVVNGSREWLDSGCLLRETIARNWGGYKELEIKLGDLRYFMWHTDVYNTSWLASERYNKLYGYAPTRVMYEGEWVQAPPSPGLSARARYVNEIYHHAVHHLHSGTDQNTLYDPVKQPFSRCASPGEHYCLDQYEEDGSLQFEDLL